MRTMMSYKVIFNVNTPITSRIQNVFARRLYASKVNEDVDIAKVSETPVYSDLEQVETEEQTKMRNKSRLNPEHRNMLFGRRPYDQPMEWYHNTVRYKRRMLGRYGMKALEVPAGLAWPTLEDVENAKEYERVAFPLSIPERWERIRNQKEQKEADIRAREELITAKMAKLDGWIQDVNEKLAKKQQEIDAAKERKERMIEEIREHFGFKISTQDERFKEMLIQREEDMKKQQKMAKKLKKQQKMDKKKLFIFNGQLPNAAEKKEDGASESENPKE